MGCDALAITDTSGGLAWDGAGEGLKPLLVELSAGVVDGGHTAVIPAGEVQELAQGKGAVAVRPDVERAAVIAPIRTGTRVVGVVAAFAPAAVLGALPLVLLTLVSGGSMLAAVMLAAPMRRSGPERAT